MTATVAGPTHATTAANGSRTYTHPTSGAVVPSVTSIDDYIGNKRGLIQGAANVVARTAVTQRELLGRDDAYEWLHKAHDREWGVKRDIGSAVHDIAERIALGQPVTSWDRAGYPGHVAALEEWFAARKPKILHVEATCWNVKAGYAGTADLICKLGSDKLATIIDWKTGGMKAGMNAQLAAYANATELTERDSSELIPMPKVKRAYVVQITEDGAVEREIDLAEGWRRFQAALAVRETENIGSTFVRPAVKIPRSADVLPACVDNLRTRALNIREHRPGGFAALAAGWPADVPTFKAGGPTSLAQCVTVDALVSRIEIEWECPF